MASGYGPTLYLPHGAGAVFLLAFTRPDTGAAIDLTGATALTFTLRRHPTTLDADAALTLEEGDGLTVIDAVAGLVRATITPAQSAALESWGGYHYRTTATLADGAVIIPDRLRGAFLNDLDSLLEQTCSGDAITRLDAASGTLTPLPPAMSNYVINRYDLTGLTGGTTVDLDGLSGDTLDALQNGAVVELFFTGSISARFRLRANTGAETESAPWKIIADNDTDRLWELIGVFKQGAPCVWNDDTALFHQVLASGTGTAISPALADEADAFTLPA